MRLPEAALHEAIVVVAHPDDEILWFSSILDRAARIVVCFNDSEHAPAIGDARQRSLDQHEYADRITNLGLEQVRSHNQSAWPDPEETDYGLKLVSGHDVDAAYVGQAGRLAEALAPLVAQAANVFTHNPWGEYGHEDHVQVSRIATRLAGESGADCWYSGYASNKSLSLMRRYATGFSNDYYTMEVDTERARRIADVYYRNDAWTFIEDYRWFDSECFLKGPLVSRTGRTAGTLCPLNLIRVPFDPYRERKRPGMGRRIVRRLRRLAASGTGEEHHASTP